MSLADPSAQPPAQPLVQPAALAAELATADPPTLLDVRWTLAGARPDEYRSGHLDRAVLVDLDRVLADPPGAGGRHPLPDPDRLQSGLREAGVRAGHPVVLYDAGGTPPTGAAARGWWILRWAGIPDVRVLDGGYAGWVAAGLPVTGAVVSPVPSDVVVRPGALAALDAAGAARLAGERRLLDARTAQRFRGEAEPVDPVAGHIPGALSQPATEIVDGQGRLLPPDVLADRFRRLGLPADRPVGAYCGSGVTAAQTVLALTVAGFDPVLYVGSWSDWITDPTRPVATGEEP